MPSTPQSFDLLIIGAGPAGTAAAMTARRAGLSLALVAKAKSPRAKLCGGLVTGRARAHFRTTFDCDLAPDLSRSHDGMLVAPSDGWKKSRA